MYVCIYIHKDIRKVLNIKHSTNFIFLPFKLSLPPVMEGSDAMRRRTRRAGNTAKFENLINHQALH